MRRFRLAAVAAAVILASSPALAGRCTASDRWRSEDKALHMGMGAIVGLGVTMQTRDPLQGLAWGVAAGAAKEIIDAGGRSSTCSLQDFAVTALGAALGAYTGRLFLRVQQHGGLQLVYARGF